MIIDGFFIKQLTNELNQSLNEARIEKIQQIDSASFLFSFYRRGERNKLILNLHAQDYRLYFTKEKVNPTGHSQFLVSLKKHLEGGILIDIKQYLSDRVITFNFSVSDYIFGPQSFQLVFEAMGKHANLMIVKNNIIIDTYKKMFFEEGRQLLPQAKFEYFPVDKKPFDQIDYETITSPKDITNTYMGISSYLSRYLYEHKIQLKDIKIQPTYNLSLNKFYCADIFKLDDEKKYFVSLSDMMDQYQNKKSLSKSGYKQFIDKQLKKCHIKENHLDEQLIQAIDQLSIKNKGDLIYMSGLNLNDKYHEIEVNGEMVRCDEHLSLNENAQKFYKLYQKAKRSIAPIKSQIEENKNLISLFDEFDTFLSLSSDNDLIDFEQDLIPYGFTSKKQQVINKKQKKKPNIMDIIDENAIYYIGKNSLQNEYITHNLSQPSDYWFHVKDGAGSHVLVKTQNLNEAVIRKAAMLAAYHSSLRYSSSIPVDYTMIRNIKKIPHKPGYQVIYKNFKTMFIDIEEDVVNSYLSSNK